MTPCMVILAIEVSEVMLGTEDPLRSLDHQDRLAWSASAPARPVEESQTSGMSLQTF